MSHLLGCLCNSRIAIPKDAGQAATWPLAVLWGGQGVAAAAAVALVVRRSRRLEPGLDAAEHAVGVVDAVEQAPAVERAARVADGRAEEVAGP